MSINIVLDEEVVKKAFKYTNHTILDVRQLLNTVKIRDDYDYKSLRKIEVEFDNVKPAQ